MIQPSVTPIYGLTGGVRILALHPELCPEFVVRQHSPAGDGVEANRCAQFGIVNEVSERRRRVGRGGPAPHHQADEAVIASDSHLVSGGSHDLDGGMRGDMVRRSASRQRDLGLPGHHVFAERGILRTQRMGLGSLGRDRCGTDAEE